jgi:flagellar hook-length control protein FliK
VVIQLSPHTEPAHIPEASQPASGATFAQKPKGDKNTLGVFAKILAGLTGRGLIRQDQSDQGSLVNAGSGGQTTDLKIPGRRTLAETGEPGLADAAVKGKRAAGKTASAAALAETGAKKTGEAELSQLEFSQQEQNILFTVSRLAVREDGQGGAKNSRLAERSLSGLEAADALRNNQETAETLSAMGKQALPVGLQTEALTQSSRDDARKTKSRAPDAVTRNDAGIGKVTGEDIAQRLEAKKVVSGEKETRNRLEETRNRRRTASFELRDFRSGETETIRRDGVFNIRAGGETRLAGDTAKEITLELRLPNQGQNSSAATTSWETRAGQSLEDMLARELHQNFNNDIVRHASIALRDGNEGTIKLALRPESLGNVKIRLEMAENKIIGHIVVESEEALRAFEREISSLEKAFRDSGFESAELEMSLASDNRGAEQQWQETEASRFLSGQYAASRYDTAVEQMEMPIPLDVYQLGARTINVLV